jgi:hypothetical protein
LPHFEVASTNRKNAKRMRHVMTDAELKLWNELRPHRLMGLSFRRQMPIAGYIVSLSRGEIERGAASRSKQSPTLRGRCHEVTEGGELREGTAERVKLGWGMPKKC